MANIKVTDEWWTSPTESETGGLIIVTGRRNVEVFIETGKYNDRVEVTWKYESDKNGLPDFKTSSLMEEITDAFNKEFNSDPVAVLTGIYTGDGERNWIFYTRSLHIFERKFNEILSPYELLPLSLYVEKDSEWNEYKEMKELSEIDEGE